MHVSDEFRTCASDLYDQGQNGLQTSTFFTTPSNLKCELIINWISAGGGGEVGLEGGGETPVFANAKKGPH